MPFAEKYIILRSGQRLTNHYHVAKTEDIINRAGGTLQLYLWNVDPATGKVLDTDVNVYMDGVLHTFKPGAEVLVEPGNSISLTPYIAPYLRRQARQRPGGGRSFLHQRRQHRQLLPRKEPALHQYRGRRAHRLPALQRIRKYILNREPSARPDRHMAGARFCAFAATQKAARRDGFACVRGWDRLHPILTLLMTFLFRRMKKHRRHRR